MDVHFTALDDLAASLKAAGVRSASADPAEVNAPGVLVQLAGVELDRLAGYTLNARLLLVVPDNGHLRSRTALAELLSTVTTVVDPDDTITPVAVTLPGSPAPLPGLSVPVDLLV